MSDKIIELGLQQHVEGGWYKQTYISDYLVINSKGAKRPSATSIIFLLQEGDFSAFHRLQADELWYYQGGSPFTIWGIDPVGALHIWKLGSDVSAGESLQVLVPKGYIFASQVEQGFGIAGCMVSPGFDYADFELFRQEELISLFPQHRSIIEKLTR